MVDELFVKVVEVKKIQGNVNIGSMKCLTRELFSFFPLVSTLKFTFLIVDCRELIHILSTLGFMS